MLIATDIPDCEPDSVDQVIALAAECCLVVLTRPQLGELNNVYLPDQLQESALDRNVQFLKPDHNY